MKCIPKKYTSREVPWDQYNYSYEFEQFESIPTATDFNFVHVMPDSKVFEDLDNFVVLNVELPNCLLLGTLDNIDVFNYDKKIKRVITNCPFSEEYFIERFNYDKFVYGYIPLNPKYIPVHGPKIFDVYHTGHSHNSAILNFYPIIEKFNSCFVCADYGKNRGIEYQEKLTLNAQSKISIVHNLIKWPEQFYASTKNFPGHRAFELVTETGLVPQIKTRVFEAVESKSLMLCYKDPWNMIESYFEEGVDFIYWTDAKDLEEKINHILAHYNDYLPVVEHAYATLLNNYTLQHFFDTYLRGL